MPVVSIALAIALGVLLLPLSGSAERMPKWVGILAAADFPAIESFRQEMRVRGWVEGNNISFEYGWAEQSDSRYPALAAELLSRKVDLMLVWGTPAAVAAKNATTTIPIVLGAIGDPVEAGVTTNFVHPGGNVTGFTSQTVELDGKRLDLLKELLPTMHRASVLSHRSNPSVRLGEAQVSLVAQKHGITVDIVAVENSDDLDASLRKINETHPEGVLVIADSLLLALKQRVIDFMNKNQLPTMYAYPEFPKAGGLISYSTDYDALLRQAAGYVDRILRGEAPGGLPIQRASKFKLVVNLNTAKSLGVTVPQAVLARADEVID